jgi:opacity protein-like surface antigen
MKLVIRIVATAIALAVVTAPLVAQRREVVVRLYAGGADHLADLSSRSPDASFTPGYNVGASVGRQLTDLLIVRADLMFTRNSAWGAASFAAARVNRFYYGVQLEGRRTLGRSWTPFAFVGLGAVSVDQIGLDRFDPFTKAAFTLGGGMGYAIPGSRIEAFGELKGITYKWDRAGFNRSMFDVTYSLGLSYRPPVKLPF